MFTQFDLLVNVGLASAFFALAVIATTDWLFEHRRVLSVIVTALIILSGLKACMTLSLSAVDHLMGIYVIAALLINWLRLGYSHNPPRYVKEQTFRTFWHAGALIALWILAADGYLLWPQLFESSIMVVIITLSLYVSIRILLMVGGMLRHRDMAAKMISDWPSVTIAIPARNEDPVLEATLHNMLESDYQKLEIIVLDDCSLDKTSQIIRAFAHRGVRFIQGRDLARGWYGKNYAYQQLLDSSDAEYILFCGADIHLGKDTIRKMILAIHTQRISMLSVVPFYRSRIQHRSPLEHFQQAARYYWQCGVSSFFGPYPPVGGSCWMASRNFLQSNGGLKAINHMIAPERELARRARRQGSYALRHARTFGQISVSASKLGRDQYEHMVRLAYPLLHRNLVLTLGVAATILLSALIPIYSLLQSIDSDGQRQWLSWFAIVTTILMFSSYLLVHMLSSLRWLWTLLPAMIINPIYAILMMLWSMIRYEFTPVQWKGRNICLNPVNLNFSDTQLLRK